MPFDGEQEERLIHDVEDEADSENKRSVPTRAPRKTASARVPPIAESAWSTTYCTSALARDVPPGGSEPALDEAVGELEGSGNAERKSERKPARLRVVEDADRAERSQRVELGLDKNDEHGDRRHDERAAPCLVGAEDRLAAEGAAEVERAGEPRKEVSLMTGA